MPKKKVGKKPKQTIIREKYYPKLRQLIVSVGEWNINYLQLANQWQVPRSTLQHWKDMIQKEIGPIDITKIGREVCRGAESNVKLLQKMLVQSEKPSQKINCIRAMNDTIKTFTEMLESYKFKVKIIEDVNVNVHGELQLTESERLKKFIENKD